MLIEEFDPDVFRQIIEYIHTSCLTLQPRTLLGISINYELIIKQTFDKDTPIINFILLGVLNAADYYDLDELKNACLGFFEVTSSSN